MATDFSFDLATRAAVAEVAAVVHRDLVTHGDLDAATAPADLTGDGVRLAGGTIVVVGPRRPLPFPSAVAELGVDATAFVYHRLDTAAEIAPQQDLVIRSAVAVLDALEGDAVLRYLSEHVWLLRRDGVLHLSDDGDPWPTGRLALVTLPHDRVPLALPE